MNPIAQTIPTQVDVIVLGAGLAGQCAALSAAEAGAEVLLLEKTSEFGGSSKLSAGSFAFAQTEDQRALGIEDSLEKLEGDIFSASMNLADPDLVRLYVQGQADAYAWLKQHGVVFHKIALSSNMSVPRTHPTDPRQLVSALQDCIRREKRITYLDGTPAEKLLRDEQGLCNGVIAAGKAIHARAVVLACGGFSRNSRLISQFAPRMSKALPAGGGGNVGDGVLMGWSMGADLIDMPFVNGTFGMVLNRYPEITADPRDEPLLRLAIYKGAIAVNLAGKRFANESISYKSLGEICLDQPKAVGFQIFDQKIMDESEPVPTSHDLLGAYEKGVVRKAETIPELAGLLGLDGDELQRTVDRYNDGVAKGKEAEFGRSALSKDFGAMVRLDKPPFYGFACTTAVLATYCGLRVNTAMQVLDVYGQVIPRLYAAGELTGGFHGAGYMSGTALGKSAIFGRIAGREAAGSAC